MPLISPYTGLSGLDAYGRAASAIGNNIANVKNHGFKASHPIYQESSGSQEQGRGVSIFSLHRDNLQGGLQRSSSPFDLAVVGEGFLTVSRGSRMQYTRSARFRPDQDGNLINGKGHALQGWKLDSLGKIGSDLGKINVGTRTLAPVQTTQISLRMNLDANAMIRPGGPAFDVARPRETANYSTALTVNDMLGKAHTMSLYMRRESETQWSWHALIKGKEVVGKPNDFVASSGILEFQNGRLQSVSQIKDFTETFSGTSGTQSITFDFGDTLAGDDTGGRMTTQFAGPSEMRFVHQDGHAPGDLLAVEIDQEGVISGRFSNGGAKPIYQLALSRFSSPWGLKGAGGNLFVESQQSGSPMVGAPGSAGMGAVQQNVLELSSVDLAGELTEMVRTEQAFLANLKSVETADQLLQQIVDIKA